MRTEQLEKLDDIFAEEQKTEDITPSEAMGLLGAVIRKVAMATDLADDEAKAMMQRAYLVVKSAEAWASDEECEVVRVPAGLLATVRKDAEGEDALVIPISEAMTEIGKRLGGDDTGAGGERTDMTKGDDTDTSAWGHDLNNDNEDDRVDWGNDPASIR
jgi:hypothetical protein